MQPATEKHLQLQSDGWTAHRVPCIRTVEEGAMSALGLEAFDRTLQLTNGWLDELMGELGTDSRQRAWYALTSVVHAIRDRLPVNEAAHLAAQLPLLRRRPRCASGSTRSPRRSTAPSASSSWARVRAPISGTIRGPFARTQAMASCDGVTPFSWATARSASTRAAFRARFSPENRGRCWRTGPPGRCR
jgi:hypothetical protein